MDARIKSAHDSLMYFPLWFPFSSLCLSSPAVISPYPPPP
jgi:hypothetical protein